uniref:Ig-like domain-containing protein n=1 Tax=Sinocyclocheilus anshuiensis TaxID=1608454 RepID=A0A671PZE4_9TELE
HGFTGLIAFIKRLFHISLKSFTEQYEVVGPAEPVFAVAGEDAILPCSVKPSISVVDMRVEWFRLDLKDSQPVHLYEDHEDRNTDQIQSYRGRTKLIHQELQRGDASLKLSSVRVSDEGLYKCFIQSRSWYDDATVNVRDGFSSGCFYFEVQVKGQTKWYLGVARESVIRKGWIRLSSVNGCWTVSLYNGKYRARESSYVLLSLSVAPQRVGVFVDYSEGLVSFYDVESMSHIYSFTNQSFNEKLYPFVFFILSLRFAPFTLKRNYGVCKLKWGLQRFHKSSFCSC